jgi:transcription initiation factor IIE alpha subunit
MDTRPTEAAAPMQNAPREETRTLGSIMADPKVDPRVKVRLLRKVDRAMRKQVLRVAPTPAYICPKCHGPYSTAEARNACKASHARVAR